MNFEPVLRNVASGVRFKVPQAGFDDLMQEGRIALWLRRDALAQLEGEHALRSAGQCARWAMLDYVRRMWPQRGLAGNLMHGSTDDVEGFDHPGPDSTFASAAVAELIENIEQRIDASSRRSDCREMRRAVLHLLASGAQGIEIAEQLGARPETVSLHKTAIAKIAAEFV